MSPSPSTRRASRPFWIETSGGAVFAWHDQPAGESRRTAVVLCRPFGYDAQCTQRAYRHLAVRLCDAGFDVLRIDYHGTGDSSGDDTDRDRWAIWSESVCRAIDWARTALRVDRVVLFGTGFGALVALETSARVDVDSLVLFAPPRSGRAWLREARALQGMTEAGGARSKAATGGEEVAGFLLTEGTVEALTSCDPTTEACKASTALIVARDDLPGGEEHLAEALRKRGVEVTLSRSPGYGAMIREDPHKSTVPEDAWGGIAQWLSERYALDGQVRAEGVDYPRHAAVRESAAAPEVREEAVDMGGLFGVLCEPPLPSTAPRLPFILLHNIGANSHVGANRMYVRMARRWAALGFSVLRFDSAGLGDSPASDRTPENRVYSEGAKADSLQAMDFLSQARGADRFVLMGLCSGAYVAFHSAIIDSRVVAVVLMNILLFHWKEGDSVDVRKRDLVRSSRFYWRSALGAASWRRLLRGKVNARVVLSGLLGREWERLRHAAAQLLSGESDVSLGFRALMRRGADVLLVFDVNDGGRDVIDAHLGTNASRFRRTRGFRLEVIENSDHTFSPLWSQERLLSLLTDHLSRLFEPRRPSSNGD